MEYLEFLELEQFHNFCEVFLFQDLSRKRFESGPVLGRDDFNFLSWIVSASSYIVSVTERNSLDSMVLVWVVPHTQHKRYPCDRNFSKE